MLNEPTKIKLIAWGGVRWHREPNTKRSMKLILLPHTFLFIFVRLFFCCYYNRSFIMAFTSRETRRGDGIFWTLFMPQGVKIFHSFKYLIRQSNSLSFLLDFYWISNTYHLALSYYDKNASIFSISSIISLLCCQLFIHTIYIYFVSSLCTFLL